MHAVVENAVGTRKEGTRPVGGGAGCRVQGPGRGGVSPNHAVSASRLLPRLRRGGISPEADVQFGRPSPCRPLLPAEGSYVTPHYLHLGSGRGDMVTVQCVIDVQEMNMNPTEFISPSTEPSMEPPGRAWLSKETIRRRMRLRRGREGEETRRQGDVSSRQVTRALNSARGNAIVMAGQRQCDVTRRPSPVASLALVPSRDDANSFFKISCCEARGAGRTLRSAIVESFPSSSPS